ncbi:Lrp/AsnC ligand binding domain-containing protein [Acinetobacter apis]|uniref:Leucine-responsive regulatory protein n=1 Tax=Acinetobacter apis TaxID=1229165 RepID=A0A217EF21_9GAMM|nr:Lrp/AsnC ligand binding domain-containing protein [Acinetobacter apis]SNQ29083.1 Lrp/AsnC family transcriptional regulator, leucine-responsive regulatory protein [Acinetobacter apis]
MPEGNFQPDRIDLKILDLLQKDGRISNAKLAEMVSLSPTAVLARVQRLVAEKYILSYHTKLNPEKLDAGFLVFVEVVLDKTSSQVLDEFAEAVQELPEITECHMTSGGFDFLIKLRSKNMEDFRRLSGLILWKLPGVKETRSYPVMQVVKESWELKLTAKK